MTLSPRLDVMLLGTEPPPPNLLLAQVTCPGAAAPPAQQGFKLVRVSEGPLCPETPLSRCMVTLALPKALSEQAGCSSFAQR